MSMDDRAAIEKQIADEVKRQLTGNDDEGESAAADIGAV
jgi:hypothetical protein